MPQDGFRDDVKDRDDRRLRVGVLAFHCRLSGHGHPAVALCRFRLEPADRILPQLPVQPFETAAA